MLSSPAGIESTTAGSTHQHSQHHHAITSGMHTSISAAKSLLASAMGAVKFFAGGGIKLWSAEGKIDIAAFRKDVNMLSKMGIYHTADTIGIRAKEQLVINGGGSGGSWSDPSIVLKTAGEHRVYVAHHNHPQGKSKAMEMPRMPFVPENTPKTYSTRLNIANLVGRETKARNATMSVPFRAYNSQGELIAKGVTDSKGNTGAIYTNKPEKIRLVLGDGDWNRSIDSVHA